MLVDFDKLKEKCNFGREECNCKLSEFEDCIERMMYECVVEKSDHNNNIISNINMLGSILDCKRKLQQGDNAIGKIDCVIELLLDKVAKVLRDDSK